MKHFTNEQILAEVQRVFDAQHEKHYSMGWESEGCLKVIENKPDCVKVEINCMYEAPSPTLEVMDKLAKFFGTQNINDDDAFSNYGCDTCDYGSSYGYTLTIRPE